MCKCVHILSSFEDVLEPTVGKDSPENSDAEGSESCPPTHLRADKAGNKHQYVHSQFKQGVLRLVLTVEIEKMSLNESSKSG